MPSQQSWFSQGSIRKALKPGKSIALTKPEPTEWKILEAIDEHNFQFSEEIVQRDSCVSYASIKLSCIEASNPSKRAIMRVYMQVPYDNTELEDLPTRAQQATTFRPKELTALLTLRTSAYAPSLLGYDECRQGTTGLVPGGFLTFLVWEIVPGLCLGDQYREGTIFWHRLNREERDMVREAFQKTLVEITKMDPFLVGFRDWGKVPPQAFKTTWLPLVGLVKTPASSRWSDHDWNGDTSRWEL
ncbi:uncharacterized protein N7498_007629 [Penicillium cinerascens]|uniref:Uncharacterized protein n=1 Tax=Penicillium cinerascens TaxID=70096 RepID=A0A9W9JL97_9EURO|nr:uncharacterized protein N7498_007629 [Penicillium cinerascens]KAJ5198512.1 hypothetical protein N7498_007629 [Penicillium cinerascens]